MKKAIVTGITGQDGAYLADWLIKQGYPISWTAARTCPDTPSTSRWIPRWSSPTKSARSLAPRTDSMQSWPRCQIFHSMSL